MLPLLRNVRQPRKTGLSFGRSAFASVTPASSRSRFSSTAARFVRPALLVGQLAQVPASFRRENVARLFQRATRSFSAVRRGGRAVAWAASAASTRGPAFVSRSSRSLLRWASRVVAAVGHRG